jgi:flagellar hook-basal body complex protein FliE
MEINGINAGMQGLLKTVKDKSQGGQFENIFSELVNDVNKAQNDSSKITQDYVTGQNNVELHDVMIAGEKAKTSLDLLMEIRNKTIDMYKELTKISL